MGGFVVEYAVLLCCFLLLSWVGMQVFYSVWWTPKKLQACLFKQGIQGHPYKLLYGNYKDMKRSLIQAESRPINLTHQIVPRVIPFLHQTAKNYGKLSITWFGTKPRVNIMDPELIREVLSNKSGHFEKTKPTPLTKFLATGIVIYEGEKWAKHRRILNPAFHQGKLKLMVPAFFDCCSEMISRWEKSIGCAGSFEINVWPELQNLTGDVISRTAFGSSYKEGTRIFQLLVEQAELLTEADQTIYIPGLRFLPTKDNNRRKEIDREVRTLLRGIIQKREEAIKMGEASNDDLLGLMMESNYRESQEFGSKSMGMTTEDIIQECKVFYFAGQETTSSLLTWTMVVLSMHPIWQDHAREEVLQVFGKNKPDFDGLSRLKIVTMILYEVLRLYPPITLLDRSVCKEMKLGNIVLPPGVELLLPTLLIHHDPEIWGEDAEEFKPERFSGGVSKASKHQVAFFPFGWGPRICIGQNFALLEAKLALSMILQQFSFELASSYAHAPYSVITLQPQHGAQIILHKL